MIKSSMYGVFELIDIEQFEKEYQKVLNDVMNGDSSLGVNEYTGLMAACDSNFQGTDSAQWDAHCVYLALMQPVFEQLASGQSYEVKVKRFLQSVTREHVKRVIDMLDAYMQVDDTCEEISDFEKYCESVESLPIINYAYSYTEKGNYLHKNVELEAQGFLGDVLAALYVLSCLVEEIMGDQPEKIRVAKAKMYAGRFNVVIYDSESQGSISVDEKGELSFEEMYSDDDDDYDYDICREDEGISSSIPENSAIYEALRELEENTRQNLEASEEQVKKRDSYEKIPNELEGSSEGKSEGVCGTISGYIATIFGKKSVPLFWIALVLLYVGSVFGGALVTFLLYRVGKKRRARYQ